MCVCVHSFLTVMTTFLYLKSKLLYIIKKKEDFQINIQERGATSDGAEMLFRCFPIIVIIIDSTKHNSVSSAGMAVRNAAAS